MRFEAAEVNVIENNSNATEDSSNSNIKEPRNIFDSLHEEVMQSDLPDAEKTSDFDYTPAKAGKEHTYEQQRQNTGDPFSTTTGRRDFRQEISG